MARLRFTKMHGCGNDYIYINCFETDPGEDLPNLARRLSDRHFGIGGDGIILLRPAGSEQEPAGSAREPAGSEQEPAESARESARSAQEPAGSAQELAGSAREPAGSAREPAGSAQYADCRMQMFNADGSEGKMCGNGVRCLAALAYRSGAVRKETILIETLSGIKKAAVTTDDGGNISVKVEMGQGILRGSYLDNHIVDMGNLHCVCFCNAIPDNIAAPAQKILDSGLFPDGVNTEFVTVIDSNRTVARVFERGSGETLACGSGACAIAFSGIKKGFFDPKKPISIAMPGGVLRVELCGSSLYLSGDCKFVFDGEIDI